MLQFYFNRHNIQRCVFYGFISFITLIYFASYPNLNNFTYHYFTYLYHESTAQSGYENMYPYVGNSPPEL